MFLLPENLAIENLRLFDLHVFCFAEDFFGNAFFQNWQQNAPEYRETQAKKSKSV